MTDCILYITPFTCSKDDLDHDHDLNLDCNLDCNPEDVPVYMGNSLFNTKPPHCCSLFSQCYIAIHLISGLKLSRFSVNMGQNPRPRFQSDNLSDDLRKQGI